MNHLATNQKDCLFPHWRSCCQGRCLYLNIYLCHFAWLFFWNLFFTFAQLHLNFCSSEMSQSLSLSFLNFPIYSPTVRSKVTTKTTFYLAYSFKIYYFGGILCSRFYSCYRSDTCLAYISLIMKGCMRKKINFIHHPSINSLKIHRQLSRCLKPVTTIFNSLFNPSKI